MSGSVESTLVLLLLTSVHFFQFSSLYFSPFVLLAFFNAKFKLIMLLWIVLFCNDENNNDFYKIKKINLFLYVLLKW
jgi:hypothetical protein